MEVDKKQQRTITAIKAEPVNPRLGGDSGGDEKWSDCTTGRIYAGTID